MIKKDSILKFEILSTIFIIILGVILHFTYEWSNNNYFVGTFSAVNESTWEHLKLVFFPMLITTIIGHFIFSKDFKNYLCAKTQGILLAMSFIVIFFYTYTGIIGTNFAILDIGSFFVAVILGQFHAYKIIENGISSNNKISLIILIVLLLCFVMFTFYPPEIGVFKDSVTGSYGAFRV